MPAVAGQELEADRGEAVVALAEVLRAAGPHSILPAPGPGPVF